MGNGRQRRPASEMFEALREMADDLFGDDDDQEKETYITEHMKKLGYRARVVFEDADDDDQGGNGGGFTTSLFGSGGSNRQRRDVQPQRRQQAGGMGGYR